MATPSVGIVLAANLVAVVIPKVGFEPRETGCPVAGVALRGHAERRNCVSDEFTRRRYSPRLALNPREQGARRWGGLRGHAERRNCVSDEFIAVVIPKVGFEPREQGALSAGGHGVPPLQDLYVRFLRVVYGDAHTEILRSKQCLTVLSIRFQQMGMVSRISRLASGLPTG